MSIRKIKGSDGIYRWEVRVYENGRGSKEIRKRFDKKVEAEKFQFQISKLKNERELNPWFREINFKRSFREEADYWYADAQHRLSPGSKKRVLGFFHEFMNEYGEKTLDFFTPEVLSKIQRQQKENGLSNATVNRKTNFFLAILNFSTRHRRIPFNPANGLRKLTEDSPEMKFWSLEEASDFLSVMNDKYPQGSELRWIYVVYLLALNTGMRAGEIWGLKPMDINFERNIISVRRQLDRVSQSLTSTKGGGGRTVPCNEELAQELRAWIDRSNIKSENPLFRNEVGQPINHDNFKNRVFNKDLKSWKGRHIRFHDMRHSAATLMIASGVDLKTVKEICGHADISTTMGYAHLVDGMVSRVALTFSVKPK